MRSPNNPAWASQTDENEIPLVTKQKRNTFPHFW